MELRLPIGLSMCVFLEQNSAKEVQSESHIENTSLCSSKKENKIFYPF